MFNLKRLHGLDFDKKDIKEPIIFAKTIKNPVRYYVEPIIPRVILRCGGISSNLGIVLYYTIIIIIINNINY